MFWTPESLRRHGAAPALSSGDQTWTYEQLADAVAELVKDVSTGDDRRLVLLPASHHALDAIGYLACLAAGFPVLVVPDANSDHVDQWTRRYDPDTILRRGEVLHRRPRGAHTLHPDLAAVMTTSGSTGSPKVVRLAREGILANALAIADYLGIRPTDNALLQLPLSYCYGLSVLMSNLAVGAQVTITDRGAVDECFWDLARQATSLSGVPYTFEMFERAGLPDRDLPKLRYVTVAGGRLAPDRVVELAQLGESRGWDLHVMYGQTEATARIAHLPAHRALSSPDRVGVAIPGGSLHIDADGDVGELVYRGPNVMLGYAHAPADLARGRDVVELRTGDIARRFDDGTFAVIGRASRFAKVGGLRIDLDHVEREVSADLPSAQIAVVETHSGLTAAVAGPEGAAARAHIARASGLPVERIHVLSYDAIPRTAAGKVDYEAIRRAAAVRPPSEHRSLCDLYARVLGRDGVTENDSFVSLRGDSLSYVEMSVALEGRLGCLPRDWHLRSIAELESVGQSPSTPPPSHPARWRALETSVVLRALAIVAVVGSHIGVFNIRGGAHLLLAIVGYNLARFQLSARSTGERLRGLAVVGAAVVVPAVAWIALARWWTGEYDWASVALVHSWLTQDPESPGWRYWFIESFAVAIVAVGALLAVPAIARTERRWPFAFPVAALVAAVGLRFALGPVEAGSRAIYTPLMVLWCVALGWAVARARTRGHRVVVSVLTVAALPGFFTSEWRTLTVLAGVMLLVWLPAVRLPRVVVPVVAALGAAALAIYLTHWQVYPLLLEHVNGWVALAGSLGFGSFLWFAVRACWRHGRRAFAATPAASAPPARGPVEQPSLSTRPEELAGV